MTTPTGAIPSGGGALVYVDDLEAPHLDDEDHHHLARVRRIRDGDPVIVSDGRGTWRPARMAGDRPEPDGDPVTETVPTPTLTIAFGLSKADKPEWVVQRLTEIGIDRIIPFTAARSVVRWDERRRDNAHRRLEKVAREASRQSRRAHLPTISPVTDFATVAALPGAARTDRDGAPPSLHHPTLLVGPEGGWDDQEARSPNPVVGLGPGVLRAETAALIAGGLIIALRGDLVRPVRR